MPAFEPFVQLGGRAITLIGRLAPLSIVLTALGILNTIRLARVKRREDQARAIRETLNTAGTSAYTLSWSLLGGMDAKVPLLELRGAIETHLGKPVKEAELLDLLSDQLLIEPMIGKAWRDSGAIERFREQAREFSRLSADIGARIPLVQEALEQINAQLRVLLLTDSTLIVSVRTKKRYRSLPPVRAGERADPLHRVMVMFLSDSHAPQKEAFQPAAEFLSRLAAVTAGASDRRMLRLVCLRRFLPRWREYLLALARERRDRRVRGETAAEFQEKFPHEAELLTTALDAVLKQTRDLRRKEQALRENAVGILHTLVIPGENVKLKEAVDNLMQVLAKEYREKILSMHALIRLKCLGFGDPEIDANLAIETGTLDLLKSAMDRGATAGVSREQVLHRHAGQLSGVEEILLN